MWVEHASRNQFTASCSIRISLCDFLSIIKLNLVATNKNSIAPILKRWEDERTDAKWPICPDKEFLYEILFTLLLSDTYGTPSS